MGYSDLENLPPPPPLILGQISQSVNSLTNTKYTLCKYNIIKLRFYLCLSIYWYIYMSIFNFLKLHQLYIYNLRVYFNISIEYYFFLNLIIKGT